MWGKSTILEAVIGKTCDLGGRGITDSCKAQRTKLTINGMQRKKQSPHGSSLSFNEPDTEIEVRDRTNESWIHNHHQDQG